MSKRLYIIRDDNRRGTGRDYLVVRDATFRWLDSWDFDSWDECKAKATTFTEVEAAILLHLMRAADVSRYYEFSIE